MSEVTRYTERILIVLAPDASIKVIEITDATALDGVVVKYDQAGMNSLSDSKVAEILNKCNAVTVLERDSVMALLQNTVQERDVAERKVSVLTAERDELLLQVAESDRRSLESLLLRSTEEDAQSIESDGLSDV